MGAIRRVGIAGVGLIGGSLGLALRSRVPGIEVLGIGRRESQLSIGLSMGAMDRCTMDLRGAVPGLDLLVLATPIEHILNTLDVVVPLLRPGALVTDVGSTKTAICLKAWECMPPGVEFIGGHPVAGRENAGVENSLPGLFEGAPYVLCPQPGRESSRIGELKEMVATLGSELFVMSPEDHDRTMAWVSHMPQLVSTALAGVAASASLELAGSGFRDMTRLAGSPFEVWKSIIGTNAANIDAALAALIEKLEEIRSRLGTSALAVDFDRAAGAYKRTRKRTAGHLER